VIRLRGWEIPFQKLLAEVTDQPTLLECGALWGPTDRKKPRRCKLGGRICLFCGIKEFQPAYRLVKQKLYNLHKWVLMSDLPPLQFLACVFTAAPHVSDYVSWTPDGAPGVSLMREAARSAIAVPASEGIKTAGLIAYHDFQTRDPRIHHPHLHLLMPLVGLRNGELVSIPAPTEDEVAARYHRAFEKRFEVSIDEPILTAVDVRSSADALEGEGGGGLLRYLNKPPILRLGEAILKGAWKGQYPRSSHGRSRGARVRRVFRDEAHMLAELSRTVATVIESICSIKSRFRKVGCYGFLHGPTLKTCPSS